MKIKHRTPHGPKRKAEYPDIGDQLDVIVKLADALRQQGIHLPQEVNQWIDKCQSVKAKYPKT